MPYDPAASNRPTARPPSRRPRAGTDRGATTWTRAGPGSSTRARRRGSPGRRCEPTAYAGGGLLVRPGRDGRVEPRRCSTRCAPRPTAGGHDARGRAGRRRAGRAGRAGRPPRAPTTTRWSCGCTCAGPRDDDRPRSAPDAWPVLQRYRAPDARPPGAAPSSLRCTCSPPAGSSRRRTCARDHAQAARRLRLGGNPYVAFGAHPDPHVALAAARAPATSPTRPVAVSAATAEYAQPGSGGRVPVTLGRSARRRGVADAELDGARRPVVAVLDTGTGGTRGWTTSSSGPRRCGRLPIGLTDPEHRHRAARGASPAR